MFYHLYKKTVTKIGNFGHKKCFEKTFLGIIEVQKKTKKNAINNVFIVYSAQAKL